MYKLSILITILISIVLADKTYPIRSGLISSSTDITISLPDPNWNFRFYQTDSVYHNNYYGVSKSNNKVSCKIYNQSGTLTYKIDSTTNPICKTAKDINCYKTPYLNYIIIHSTSDTLYALVNQVDVNVYAGDAHNTFMYFFNFFYLHYIYGLSTLILKYL